MLVYATGYLLTNLFHGMENRVPVFFLRLPPPGSCLVPGAKSHSLGAILCGVRGSGDRSYAVAALQPEVFFYPGLILGDFPKYGDPPKTSDFPIENHQCWMILRYFPMTSETLRGDGISEVMSSEVPING